MKRPKDAILQDLARERNRVAQLERARADALARIESLRVELEATSKARDKLESPRMELDLAYRRPAPESQLVTIGSTDGIPHTPADKVRLFRCALGREDRERDGVLSHH
jgi:hypothetical protein